jgi:RNA polymerase primary sigma factor
LDEDEVEQYQSKVQGDPVRMYLCQMGQVPLLTRDQAVAISKRREREELKGQDELVSIHLTPAGRAIR